MNQATTIAAYLREKLPFAPDIALVLGSGLGGLAEQIENAVIIPYRSVPGFPVSTAPGHAGQFVAGQLAGKNVLCMQGRFHYYEGHDMAAIALPVRVFKALGCRALVLTNAAGGVNWDSMSATSCSSPTTSTLWARTPCAAQTMTASARAFAI